MADISLPLYVEGSEVDIEGLEEMLANDDWQTAVMEGIATLLGQMVAQEIGGKRYYQVETLPVRLQLPDVPEW